jgi:hypothetical protein
MTDTTRLQEDIIISTTEQASIAVIDYLDNIAVSPRAKQILADFYDNFSHVEQYIWAGSNIIEIDLDTELVGIDFDVWEIAFFAMPLYHREGGLFILPEFLMQIFSESEELIHPKTEFNDASYEVTFATRWFVDPYTGKIRTTNPNSLRLEAELSKFEDVTTVSTADTSTITITSQPTLGELYSFRTAIIGTEGYSFPIYIHNNETLHLYIEAKSYPTGLPPLRLHVLTPSMEYLHSYGQSAKYEDAYLDDFACQAFTIYITQFSPSYYDWGEGYYRFTITSDYPDSSIEFLVEYWVES